MPLTCSRGKRVAVLTVQVALLFASAVHVHVVLAIVADEASPQSERNNSEYDAYAYWVGTGSYDMTGPAAQINFLGYAQLDQTARGIHQRQRARAFIIADNAVGDHYNKMDETVAQAKKEQASVLRARKTHDNTLTVKEYRIDPNSTVCFVSIDAAMGSDLLNLRVLTRLDQLADQYGYGELKGLCHTENLVISATHSHSAPGAYVQYLLFQITSLGFAEEVMRIYTEGIAQALLQAYRRMQLSSMDVAQGNLFDSNINRSPTSYLLNPPEERAVYDKQGVGNTDKNMVQLSFTSITNNNKTLGLLNWFAVHATSMNYTNRLISGDNKGYASYLTERYFNGNRAVTGTGDFVAAFASSNLGDVSPNTAGEKCIDTGLPCDDPFRSTCGDGDHTKCIAFGPGTTMLESTAIIGRKQFEHALKLLQLVHDHDTNADDSVDGFLKATVMGAVAYRHAFLDMSNINVTLDNGDVVRTCPAALGYAFAAGTTDGPSDLNFFTQGTNTSNAFWNLIGDYLSLPSEEQRACHAPKPILLNLGKISKPYPWEPKIVPISIFRVGQLFILNVPGEFTTMAGRRLREAVRQVLLEKGVSDPVLVIAGLANSYSHYITTVEEYAGQRYEAASTLYGPHTLSAYIQEFRRLATDLITDQPSQSALPPPDLSNKLISLIPTIGVDAVPLLAWKWFGSVAVDVPRDEYRVGETVAVSFHSANPRNNPRLQGTFLTVDVLDQNTGEWQTRYVDGDWCTQYHWKGGIGYWGVSFAEIFWKIPDDQDLPAPALYRICHYGTRATLLGALQAGFSMLPATAFFGSYAANLLLQILSFWQHLSNYIRKKETTPADSMLPDASGLQEFEGCSRTFLVR